MGHNLQVPDNPGVHSIEDADRVHPPQTYAAGSHTTTGRRKGTSKHETAEPVPRPDSGVSVDAIYAPRRDYQGGTPGPRVADNKQNEAAFRPPPKAPIKQVFSSKKASSGIDTSGYAAPLPPTFSDKRPATQPMISWSESCLTGRYPKTMSQSLQRYASPLLYLENTRWILI